MHTHRMHHHLLLDSIWTLVSLSPFSTKTDESACSSLQPKASFTTLQAFSDVTQVTSKQGPSFCRHLRCQHLDSFSESWLCMQRCVSRGAIAELEEALGGGEAAWPLPRSY